MKWKNLRFYPKKYGKFCGILNFTFNGCKSMHTYKSLKTIKYETMIMDDSYGSAVKTLNKGKIEVFSYFSLDLSLKLKDWHPKI